MSSESPSQLETDEARALIETFRGSLDRIREEIRKVIVGQDEVVEHLLMTLLVGGHCLITGLPGTAKTLLVQTLASALGLTYKRIQFTPDLMPTDVTGTDIIEEDITTGRRTWTFVPGPLFTNIMLADEINRTPPKTQSALLEAMQELSVTVRGNHHAITPPFFVLATQNPIELEGTYPLPEAQLDRFLFNVVRLISSSRKTLRPGAVPGPSCPDRCSRISCSPTRSIGRRPRPNPLCSKPCRNSR